MSSNRRWALNALSFLIFSRFDCNSSNSFCLCSNSLSLRLLNMFSSVSSSVADDVAEASSLLFSLRRSLKSLRRVEVRRWSNLKIQIFSFSGKQWLRIESHLYPSHIIFTRCLLVKFFFIVKEYSRFFRFSHIWWGLMAPTKRFDILNAKSSVNCENFKFYFAWISTMEWLNFDKN